jgi:hypothetical protein
VASLAQGTAVAPTQTTDITSTMLRDSALATLLHNYQQFVAQSSVQPTADVNSVLRDNALATLVQNYQRTAAQQQVQAPEHPSNVFNTAPTDSSLLMGGIGQRAAFQNAGFQLPGAVTFPNTLTNLATMGATIDRTSVGQTQQAPSFAQFSRGELPSYPDQNRAAQYSVTTNSTPGASLGLGGFSGVPYASLYAAPASFGQNNSGLGSREIANRPPAAAGTGASDAPPQNNPMSQESILLLSNPPRHPILQEFAQQYLPYFDNSHGNEETGHDGSCDADGKEDVG